MTEDEMLRMSLHDLLQLSAEKDQPIVIRVKDKTQKTLHMVVVASGDEAEELRLLLLERTTPDYHPTPRN